MQTRELSELVDALTSARDAAASLTQRAVAGVRAVETRPGTHHYLCALGDGAIVCLDDRFSSVANRERAAATVRTALLAEHAEEVIDAAELSVLQGTATQLAETQPDGDLRASLAILADAARCLGEWRQAPARALASVPRLDDAVTLHEQTRSAYLRFVAATDPLVSIQESLPDVLRSGLREVEQACGRAGIAGQLTPALAGALEGIDRGVDELLERYALPFEPSSGVSS